MRSARSLVARRAEELERADLADDAALVVSELVTNALLHGNGCTGVEVTPTSDGLRIEVHDRSRVPPVQGRPSEGSLTGRGVRLVADLASRWGVRATASGKVVWAEVTGRGRATTDHLTADELLDMWDDSSAGEERRFHIELGDVPTDLLLAAKSHVDDLSREFALASSGAARGVTADVPAHLASLLGSVVSRFTEARMAIKHQALEAAARGADRTSLALDLPESAADAAEEYVRALDEIDAYCRAQRLLTLETPAQHRVFRHWYVSELVSQLRSAAAGRRPPPPQSFESRVLAELDRVAGAHRQSDRAARLYAVAAALARADTQEAVAQTVLNEGVEALGAAGGGVLLLTGGGRLALPAAVGYDEGLVGVLRDEVPGAELPASVVMRTGEAVWVESRSERDRRFPQLAEVEAETVSLCAVPLELQGRRLGALRFSFRYPRLFDEDERRFVLALAAQTAQALARAQLQQARADVSRRLQKGLLPPSLPAIPGFDVAAIYHRFGDGMEVGGDFYDLWKIGPGRWGVAIGDAVGTGPEAATLTVLVRYTLRAAAMGEPDSGRVLRTVNHALRDAGRDVAADRLCALLFGTLTPGGQAEVRLATGGHPAPLIRRAGGTFERLAMRGSMLGAEDEPDVGTARAVLAPGDTMVLFTDGVLQARDERGPFGIEGVMRVLADGAVDAHGAAVALEEAVVAHAGGSLADDLAAVVLHVPERSADDGEGPGPKQATAG